MKIAVASSSSLAIITAVLEKFGVSELMDAVHSAHDEPYGKPHPAVFLRTAETLQVHTDNCVVFEDSPNGVIAAKAAKMKCIAVPDPANLNDKRFGIADAILPSLQDFTVQMLGDLH
jgi:sugar-phosphatase